MGPWGIAAIAALAAVFTETGRSVLRNTVKGGVKVGLQVKECADDLGAKVKVYSKQFTDEVEAERNQDQEELPVKKKKRTVKTATSEA